MSSALNVLKLSSLPTTEAALPAAVEARGNGRSWDVDAFDQEQLAQLVRRVFFPASSRPARQVVFTAIDEGPGLAQVCWRTAEQLAKDVPGKVCLLDGVGEYPGGMPAPLVSQGDSEKRPRYPVAGGSAASTLTVLTANEVFGEATPSVIAFQKRLNELRREFEYTLIGWPYRRQAALLAQPTDGIVLVIQSHRTRRAAALQFKKNVQASHVRLLGSVLAGRRFPIPDRLYQRL